jgi:hypothetical protein
MERSWWFTESAKARPTRWRWRLLADDGSIEQESREFESYGEAVRDAIVSGFRPTDDHWVIESTHLVTHYAHGKQSAVRTKDNKSPGVRAGKWPGQPEG